MNNTDEILKALETMPGRCSVADVLNRFGLVGEAAEIGVDMGHFATAVLKVWRGKAYYAVDLWAEQDKAIYPEAFDHDLSYRHACALAAIEPRVRIMRMLSVEAAARIPDGSLDWVWIDANHEYGPVLEDIRAWWPKVRPGGVFSGHDFWLPGVYSAVNEWMAGEQMEFVTSDSSWWSVKGKEYHEDTTRHC